MDASFYQENRRTLYDSLEDGSLLVIFAGQEPRQSADAYYPFFCNRNFAYLTGLSSAASHHFILLAEKSAGDVRETLFLLPPDDLAERWTGRRIKQDEARAAGNMTEIAFVKDFEARFHRAAESGAFHTLALDLWKHMN